MTEENPSTQNLPGIDEGKASDESIVKTHARIRRQPVAASPVAFFSYMALILVIIFGWFYLRRYTAGFDSQMYLHERGDIVAFENWKPSVVEKPETPFENGMKNYLARCSICHRPEGEGIAGTFPPLAGSEWVTHDDASLPIKIVLAGLGGEITVKGQTYNGNMAPVVSDLNDQEIANIVTYIRQSWGNEASEATAEQVVAIKDEIGPRGPWTPDELRSYFE